jgi:hypothetical protein
MDKPDIAFGGLCSTLTRLAIQGVAYAMGAAVGGPVGGELARQVSAHLYNSVAADEQAVTVDNKLDRLIGLHYRAGKKWLEEANNQTRLLVKQQYIEHALEAFINASVIEAPANAARAEAYVGTCHGLLGRPDLKNFETAYPAFLRAESQLLDATRPSVALRGCWQVDILSRKQFIYTLVQLGKMPPKPTNEQVTELYRQIAGLVSLLTARKSKLANASEYQLYRRRVYGISRAVL